MSETDQSLHQSSFFKDSSSNEVVHNLDLTAREFRHQIEGAIARTEGDVVITGHSGDILPDGDDIFSVLAMKRILEKKYPDKHPKVVLSELPVHMWDAFIREGEITWARTETIQDQGNDRRGDVVDHVQKGDTLLCLDQGSLSHFSRFPDRLKAESGIQTVIVDHHAMVSDPRANVRLREPGAAATTELIARMFPIEELDPETCSLLYLGMSSDTGGFSFRDYGDTKRLADDLLAKSGKTAEELKAMIKPEPQADIYANTYPSHHTVIPASEGKPAVAYEYLSPEEAIPTEPTDNPDFCHQVALRRAVGAMRQKGDSTVQFAFAPANDSDKGDMVPAKDRYKVEFRRSQGESMNLSKLAKAFGGGGHEAASGATLKLSPEQLEYIAAHQQDEGFNQMEYIASLVVDKMKNTLPS